MAYLLDTNILSNVVRHPDGVITDRIRTVGEDQVCTSIIVASELRFGSRKRGSARLDRQVHAVLNAMSVLPLEEPADAVYALLRASLESKGSPVGANDLLIAAHALATDNILVTDNTREFSRIDGLQVENWLRT